MSVRRFMTISLLAVGMLPLLVFGVSFSTILKRHLESDVTALTGSILSAVSSEVSSRCIDGTRRVLPTALLLTEYETDPRKITTILQAFVTPRPEYASLILVGADGRVEAMYPEIEGTVGSVYSFHSTPNLGDVSFSSPFASSLGQRVVFEAVYQSMDRSMVSLMDMSWFSSKLLFVGSSPLDRLGVVDAGGKYLMCSDPSRVVSGESVPDSVLEGGASMLSSEGRQYYVSSLVLRGSPWRAVYYRDRADAEAPLAGFRVSLAILLAGSMLFALSLSFAARRIISAPISLFIKRIERICEGHYDERVSGDFSYEFHEIGDAFNSMAASIERRDRALLESEERYRLLFQGNKAPAILMDLASGDIRDVNMAACLYYGYERAEMLGMSFWTFFESPREELEEGIFFSSKKPHGGLLARQRLKSGELRDTETYVAPLMVDGHASLHCVVFDVTERRIAEERIKTALAEKTLLLREVYHRVKNNLQIISSLLNMQSDSSDDPAVKAALKGGQDRVITMSLAHELVYQMEDLSSIGLDEYALRLVAYLADAYGVSRDRLELRLIPLVLDLECALPIGLMLTELLTNAFKYACAKGPEIKVLLAVRTSRDDPGLIELTVEDDGPGMPSGFIPSEGRSLGVSIVTALAQQLHGDVAWNKPDSGQGTRVVFRFPHEGADVCDPEGGGR